MNIGIIGLGKMGQQIVARLVKAGHSVVALDSNSSAQDHAKGLGAAVVRNRQELVEKLGSPAVVWLMIPAVAVQDEVEALLPLMQSGDIIIDGGNSDYRQTRERATMAAAAGVQLVDVGTSGGVHGLRDGFSLMVGGEATAVATATPILEALAQPQGWHHFGPAGAGHFVKMVHNGIEYGLMQAYAEGYEILKENRIYPELDLAAVANVWQHGSIVDSHLNQLAAEILKRDQSLEGIEGVVAESGEARWTVETAQDAGIATPVITASLEVRVQSQQGKTSYATKLLSALRNAFGGHALNR